MSMVPIYYHHSLGHELTRTVVHGAGYGFGGAAGRSLFYGLHLGTGGILIVLVLVVMGYMFFSRR